MKLLVILQVTASLASLRGVPNTPGGKVEGVKPSAVVGCPAGFKDCGHCRCVPADTCSRGFCDGPGPTNGNGSNVDPDSNISMRPSTVIGCPQSHVDCGPCLCVPSSTCTWCPGGGTAPPVVNPVTPRNSSVPYCPQDYVDCGSCLCVPETTCGSCPLLPVQILPVPLPNTSTRPSAIPGCPKGNVDCGTCLCVPESSCRWCPGALPGGNGSSPVPVTKPSKVPLCPASYVDCGRCSCVAESTCQFCSDEATTATTTRATTVATTVATTTTTTVATTGAVTTTAPGATSTALVTTTSTAEFVGLSNSGCYVDCGTCLCVAQETCILCPGAWTNPTDKGQIVSKPSSVPYCPASYVDCGTCLCVPQSSCQYCPGAWSGGSSGSGGGSSTPRPTPEIVARPSTVPYCPASYVDCGTCLCVPYATCQWCPGAYSSTPVHPGPALPAPPRPSLGHINSRPSVVIGCPASYVDCGTCLCVPLTSCQWCPGAYSPSRPSRPSPAPAPAPINSRPSTVPGCPASYVDCGTCLCVPQTTCRWCPGATAPAPALPAPVPSKADHLRCRDARRATRTAAHVFACQKPLASGAQGPPCQSRHQHQSPRDPSRADPREFQGAHEDMWIAAPACASCRPPVSIALVPVAHVAWKMSTALKVWSSCSKEVIGLRSSFVPTDCKDLRRGWKLCIENFRFGELPLQEAQERSTKVIICFDVKPRLPKTHKECTDALILMLFVAWVRTDQEGTKGIEFLRNSEDVFALRF